MGRLINLTGQKYNKLTVIKYLGNYKWECLCDCGNITNVRRTDLKNNHTKSCGCLALKNAKTHGSSRSKEYKSWSGMKTRCYNPNAPKYKNYGGRGIKVCDRWLNSFENFYEDMGEKPKGYSIERIDVNGDYCLENCKWASNKEQSYNRRNTLFIKYNGEIKTLNEWSKILNVSYGTLKNRFHRNGTFDLKNNKKTPTLSV